MAAYKASSPRGRFPPPKHAPTPDERKLFSAHLTAAPRQEHPPSAAAQCARLGHPPHATVATRPRRLRAHKKAGQEGRLRVAQGGGPVPMEGLPAVDDTATCAGAPPLSATPPSHPAQAGTRRAAPHPGRSSAPTWWLPPARRQTAGRAREAAQQQWGQRGTHSASATGATTRGGTLHPAHDFMRNAGWMQHGMAHGPRCGDLGVWRCMQRK